MTTESPPPWPAARGFQSVHVKVHGRFMLQDHTEHECQLVEMSPGTAVVQCDAAVAEGQKVVAYIDHLGRIEGEVFEAREHGFAMTVHGSERKRERLAAQLTWLANRHELNLPEDRRHERVQPTNPVSMLRTAEGEYQCRIIDLSLSGAAVEVDVRPPIGSEVMLGAMRGCVVRHFEGGVALEFATLQAPGNLQQDL